jgi:hypothetical protein
MAGFDGEDGTTDRSEGIAVQEIDPAGHLVAGSGSFTPKAPLLLGTTTDTSSYQLKFNPDSSHPFYVDVPLASKGAASLPFQLGRIDVDDVTLRDASGGPQTASGLFTVERKGADGTFTAFSSCTYGTKTGIDVPPGTYRITTTYFIQGSMGRSVDTVTVP